MQKGIATLEIVLAVFIIAVLASCAVPNAVRILDRISLDYEIKNFYTELRFLQSHGRMTFMRDSHFNNTEKFQNKLTVYPEKYVVEKNGTDKIYSQHYFLNGVTASKKSSTENWAIMFDDMGKPQSLSETALDGHIVIKSRLGKEFYFIFNTVGRFRAGRTKPK
ncbi:MAG: hypothetical protein J5497_07815 [Selenomonadaceae bacterium]|nr:hypothetical protein [Selenomonadaceae bacterium]